MSLSFDFFTANLIGGRLRWPHRLGQTIISRRAAKFLSIDEDPAAVDRDERRYRKGCAAQV
jgi:hypothetical protein